MNKYKLLLKLLRNTNFLKIKFFQNLFNNYNKILKT